MTEKTSDTPRISGHVLVVDDDEAFRNEIKELLDPIATSVVLQDSASHALRFLQNSPWNWHPAMVITDIVMDGMGGYQLIRRLQELFPKGNVPVIVISRLDAACDVTEAEVAGAAAYLSKPIDRDRLYRTIEKVIENEKRGMTVFSTDLGKKRI